ncbi:MAG: serine hydrolase [Bacteroidota bacterium]
MISKAFIISIFFTLVFNISFYSQKNILDSLLNNLPIEQKKLLDNKDLYRLQIIYTKISYSQNDSVRFEDYYFNYSDTLYNYPASMVKLPASIVSIKKTEVLNNPEIDWNNKIIFDSLFCQKAMTTDSIGLPYYPHLQKWIKRMCIISDNDAYTHTYDYINCRTFHQWLKEWGFENARISHKFISKCINDSTYYTPTMYILNKENDTIYIQHQDSMCKFSKLEKNYSIGYTIKKIKKKRRTIRIKMPKTFIHHNDWTLAYSHQLMKYLVFDNYLKKLSLYFYHRDSLIKYLGAYPREYAELLVDTNAYYDTWKKFFIYEGKYKSIQHDTLRSINIIGRAYGFLSETAYIVDFKNKIDFLLSASIYVNPDNLMNGKYDYETAYCLFYQISRLIYEYEKKQPPKASSQFQYYEKLFTKNN